MSKRRLFDQHEKWQRRCQYLLGERSADGSPRYFIHEVQKIAFREHPTVLAEMRKLIDNQTWYVLTPETLAKMKGESFDVNHGRALSSLAFGVTERN